jgi:ATP-dependent DNA ligase
MAPSDREHGGVAWPSGVMLAKPVADLPPDASQAGGCLYEPKWDGYRALVAVDSKGRSRVRSRRGVDLTTAFPDIAGPAATQLPRDTILDGELVVWDGQRLDFTQLQRRVIAPTRAAALARDKPASFVAFDVLIIAGKRLATLALRERRRALEHLRPRLSSPLQINPATEDRDLARRWLADYAIAGVAIEGLVIKALNDAYLPGRRAWLKLRSRATAEAIVGAVTGTLTTPDRLILALPRADGVLVVAGGTAPLNPRQSREIAALLRPPSQPHPWPNVLPAGRTGTLGGPRHLPITLVDPVLVVEIEVDTAYEYLRWRHMTRLLRPRPDLDVSDIQRPASKPRDLEDVPSPPV